MTIRSETATEAILRIRTDVPVQARATGSAAGCDQHVERGAVVKGEGDMALALEQAKLGRGDMIGLPPGMGDGHDQVLPPLPEGHRRGHPGELEAPVLALREIVV